MSPTGSELSGNVTPTEIACRAFDGWFDSVEQKVDGLRHLWLCHLSMTAVEVNAEGAIEESSGINFEFLHSVFQQYASLRECRQWRRAIHPYVDSTRFYISAALDWLRIQGLQDLPRDLERRERLFYSETVVHFEEFFRMPESPMIADNFYAYADPWDMPVDPIMPHFDIVSRKSASFSAYLRTVSVTARRILGIDTADEQDAEESNTETLSPSDAGPEHNATERSILEALRKVGHRMTTDKLLAEAVGSTTSQGKNALSSLRKREHITNRSDTNPRGYGLPGWD